MSVDAQFAPVLLSPVTGYDGHDFVALTLRLDAKAMSTLVGQSEQALDLFQPDHLHPPAVGATFLTAPHLLAVLHTMHSLDSVDGFHGNDAIQELLDNARGEWQLLPTHLEPLVDLSATINTHGSPNSVILDRVEYQHWQAFGPHRRLSAVWCLSDEFGSVTAADLFDSDLMAVWLDHARSLTPRPAWVTAWLRRLTITQLLEVKQ